MTRAHIPQSKELPSKSTPTPRNGQVKFDAGDAERAELALARFAASHQSLLRDMIERLIGRWALATKDLAPDKIAACLDIAHDLKGLGATLGVPLVTTLSSSLSSALRLSIKIGRENNELVNTHITALKLASSDQGTQELEQIARLIEIELKNSMAR